MRIFVTGIRIIVNGIMMAMLDLPAADRLPHSVFLYCLFRGVRSFS
jgi:hypothetical protein